MIYLPIPHTPPSGGELSNDVKAKAGLDSARQWVLIAVCYGDTWPFDLRHIPTGQAISTAICRRASPGSCGTHSRNGIEAGAAGK